MNFNGFFLLFVHFHLIGINHAITSKLRSHQSSKGNQISQSFASKSVCPDLMTFPAGSRIVPALPDENARYDSITLVKNSGNWDAIKVVGVFPHSRYYSFNVYDSFGIKPLADLPDFKIDPLPGHTNPFLPGADRSALNRSFELYMVNSKSDFVVPDDAPYMIIPEDVGEFKVMVRCYRADEGLDDWGGVDKVKLVPLSNEGVAICPDEYPTKNTIEDGLSIILFNEVAIQNTEIEKKIQGDEVIFVRPPASKYFPCAHNSYLIGAMRGYGVSIIRFKVPEYEDTFSGSSVFNGTTETRYWSICVYGLAMATNIDCIEDDTTPIDKNGFATIAIAPMSLKNATESAGLGWVRSGHGYDPIIVYRQIMQREDFDSGINNVIFQPQEVSTNETKETYFEYDARNSIGDYAPYGRHMSDKAYTYWLDAGDYVSIFGSFESSIKPETLLEVN